MLRIQAMRLAKALVIASYFFCSVVCATDYAYVLGGGSEYDATFFNPTAHNWYFGLKRLGWQVKVFFGDAYQTLPSVSHHQQPFSLDLLLTEFRNLKEIIKNGDNILVTIVTHGERCVQFDPVNFQDNLHPEQILSYGDHNDEIQPLLEELKQVDALNGNGVVIFWNSSCYSGASIRALEKTGICAISQAGENQSSYPGNTGAILAEALAGKEKEVSRFLEDIKIETPLPNDFSLGKLIANYLPFDKVSPSVYSNGFGLNTLNLEDHRLFLVAFQPMFKELEIPFETIHSLENNPAKNDIGSVCYVPSRNEALLSKALRENPSLKRQLDIESENVLSIQFYEDPANDNFPFDPLDKKLEYLKTYSGRIREHYKLITMLASYISSDLRLRTWTLEELKQRRLENLPQRSYLFRGHPDFIPCIVRLLNLLTQADLDSIKTYLENEYELILRAYEETPNDSNREKSPHRNLKDARQERNQLLSYAFSKSETTCAQFNLKRN